MNIWNDCAAKKASVPEAQRRLLALDGGIKDPSWHRPRAEVHDGQRAADDAGQLHRDQLGADLEAVDARARGRDAGLPAGPERGAGRIRTRTRRTSAR